MQSGFFFFLKQSVSDIPCKTVYFFYAFIYLLIYCISVYQIGTALG